MTGPQVNGRIVSLQVGLPRTTRTADGREWRTAIVKAPADGRVRLGPENLDGDFQANRKHHGGPDKAVCGYSAEHYPGWRRLLGIDLPFGAFGENVTVEGMTEDAVCIGDVFATAPAGAGVLVQVSQPRQPCANISKRWDRPDLPRRMEESGRTGFYLRVVRQGDLAAGDALVLAERPHPGWTLERCNALMYGDGISSGTEREEIAALRALDALSAEWKRILGRKLQRRGAGEDA